MELRNVVPNSIASKYIRYVKGYGLKMPTYILRKVRLMKPNLYSESIKKFDKSMKKNGFKRVEDPNVYGRAYTDGRIVVDDIAEGNVGLTSGNPWLDKILPDWMKSPKIIDMAYLTVPEWRAMRYKLLKGGKVITKEIFLPEIIVTPSEILKKYKLLVRPNLDKGAALGIAKSFDNKELYNRLTLDRYMNSFIDVYNYAGKPKLYKLQGLISVYYPHSNKPRPNYNPLFNEAYNISNLSDAISELSHPILIKLSNNLFNQTILHVTESIKGNNNKLYKLKGSLEYETHHIILPNIRKFMMFRAANKKQDETKSFNDYIKKSMELLGARRLKDPNIGENSRAYEIKINGNSYVASDFDFSNLGFDKRWIPKIFDRFRTPKDFDFNLEPIALWLAAGYGIYKKGGKF